MKISKLLVMGLVSSCLLMGCKSSTQLTAGKLENSALSVNKKGKIQVATVESFEQPYYSESELQTYLEDVVADYNKQKGSKRVTMDSFLVKDGIASAVFDYQSIDNYSELNGVSGVLLPIEKAKEELPDTLVRADDNQSVTYKEILEDKNANNYKVLILQEEYDVIVEGTIAYFSNGTKLSDSSVHTKAIDGDTSVIIYK
ncbi:MAG: hypothetical protein ACERKN_13320 [Velocimicrobium sp.]